MPNADQTWPVVCSGHCFLPCPCPLTDPSSSMSHWGLQSSGTTRGAQQLSHLHQLTCCLSFPSVPALHTFPLAQLTWVNGVLNRSLLHEMLFALRKASDGQTHLQAGREAESAANTSLRQEETKETCRPHQSKPAADNAVLLPSSFPLPSSSPPNRLACLL